MTKQQKVEAVLSQVKEARRWYTKDEYMQMQDRIWDGLDRAEVIAKDGAPQPQLPGVEP